MSSAPPAQTRRPTIPPPQPRPPVGSDAWAAQLHTTLFEAFGRIARRRF
jgi:hypothetical protein